MPAQEIDMNSKIENDNNVFNDNENDSRPGIGFWRRFRIWWRL